ncbi:MAG TPA: MauE/DoxX family redox-associated membrane protein [Hanamia sp.]
MKKKIPDIICGLLILLFLYAAISKLLAFGQFRFVLSRAPLTGNHSTLIAALVPAMELIIAALLIIPSSSKAGMMSAVSLLIVFTTYVAFMVLTDPDLPCSCGGVIQQLSWKQHIAFNIFFIVLAIIGIYFQRHTLFKAKQRTDIL